MAIKEVVLDESILDIDAWLPKEAVEEIVQAIVYQERLTKSNPQHIHELNRLNKKGVIL